MKHLKLFWAMLSIFSIVACTSKEKSVEDPFFESANSISVDIRKVEMNDTATIVCVDVYHSPKSCIKFRPEMHLLADGKRYDIKKVEGAPIDSQIRMPESGEASFRIQFEPIPLRTKSLDFIEGDILTDWNIYGVDLTGTKKFTPAKEISAEALQATEHCPDTLPQPEYTIGETLLKIHLINNRTEKRQPVTLYVNTITGGQETYSTSDYQNGHDTRLRFWQYGPAVALIQVGQNFMGEIWLKAGETADIYLDTNLNTYRLLKQREKRKKVKCPINNLYSTGAYAWMSGLQSSETRKYMINVHKGKYTNPKQIADEYIRNIVQQYKALADSIENSGLTGLEKKMARANLRQSVVIAAANGDAFGFHHELTVKQRKAPRMKRDYMQEKHFAQIAELFDVTDYSLIWGQDFEWYVTSYRQEGPLKALWPKNLETEKSVLGILGHYNKYAKKVECGDSLTDKELEVVKAIDNDFVRAMLLKKNERVIKKLRQ